MAGMNNHNERLNNVLNADPDLKHLNHRYSAFDGENYKSNLRTDIEGHISINDVSIKKNNVLAIEHLMTFSPDFIDLKKKEDEKGSHTLSGSSTDIKKWEDFKKSSLKWLRDRYGKDNIVNISIHYDEKTPHIHAYAVPIKEKTVKWKNKSGEGEKSVKSLCARDYLGGKDKMRDMQDSFHSSVAHLGLERGKKGSLAKHEHIQKYYDRVNEANEVEKDIDKFQVKSPDQFELSQAPMFGKDKWKEEEENRINNLLETAKNEAIGEFKAEFEGEIERTIESRKQTSVLKAKTSRLSNDLSKSNEKLVLERKRLEEASKGLKRKDKTINSWKRTVKDALIHKDPEAQQALLNAVNPPEQKQSKDKGRSM